MTGLTFAETSEGMTATTNPVRLRRVEDGPRISNKWEVDDIASQPISDSVLSVILVNLYRLVHQTSAISVFKVYWSRAGSVLVLELLWRPTTSHNVSKTAGPTVHG